MQGKITKGDVVRITGSATADGVMYWTATERQSVRAAAIVAGESFVIGPYISDANYTIAMKSGAPIIENLGRQSAVTPVPLADFVQPEPMSGADLVGLFEELTPEQLEGIQAVLNPEPEG